MVSCSDLVGLGHKLPVLVKPPYKVVANVIITSQPEKIIYTYGDTLDLTGLEVAIFYDYGDPAEIIKLADFAQYNIITSPANGDMLTFVDNNSQPIEVTCKQVPAAAAADPELESKTAKTWNLTVYKAGTVVEWPSMLSASFKQILSDIDLSAHTSNGTGSFEWDAPGDRVYTGETVTLGFHEHRLTFIPNDHGNYESYTIRVNVRVTAGIEMVRVGAGSFTMGSEDDYDNTNNTINTAYTYTNIAFAQQSAKPVCTVTLSEFNIGKYEITQDVWEIVMGENPAFNNSGTANSGGSSVAVAPGENQGRRPAETFNWCEAVVFCNKLSVAEGLTPAYSLNGNTETDSWGVGTSGNVYSWIGNIECNWNANGYRLPTEAQWEYAAKGGSLASQPYYTYTGSNNTDEVAWYGGNSDNKSHEVGLKKPNQLGIHDMSGNVAEFVWDSGEASYTGNETNPIVNPWNIRITIRGGTYNSGDIWDADYSEYYAYFRFEVIRSTNRSWTEMLTKYRGFGIRVVRPVD